MSGKKARTVYESRIKTILKHLNKDQSGRLLSKLILFSVRSLLLRDTPGGWRLHVGKSLLTILTLCLLILREFLKGSQ